MKKLKTFWTGIIAIAMGIAFGIHANLSTYMDSEGVIHDTFSTPLSAILIAIGIILLISDILIYFFTKNRSTK